MAFANKRGQEGITLTTILLLVLGAVVVILVILFATGFFDRLNDTTNSAGSKLDIAVKACQLVGSQELVADYCLTYREIEVDGESMYVTCEYPEIKNLVDKSALGNIKCSENQYPNATAYCINEKISGNTKIQEFTSVSSSTLKSCKDLTA